MNQSTRMSDGRVGGLENSSVMQQINATRYSAGGFGEIIATPTKKQFTLNQVLIAVGISSLTFFLAGYLFASRYKFGRRE